MKKYLLFNLLLLPFSLNGQNSFMALSFGGNIPLQDFAKDTRLTHHGFALSGFTGDYSGAFFLKKNIGLSGNIRYASNSVNENAILDLLAEGFPSDFPLSDEPSYITGFWKYVSVLTGPEYTFTSKRINFDLYTQVGLNFVLPIQMSTYAANFDDYYDRRLDIRTVNLAIEAGCALRYHLNAYSSVRIHLGWFLSKCKGEITEVMEVQGTRTSDNIEYSCLINSVNAGIGIAYRL